MVSNSDDLADTHAHAGAPSSTTVKTQKVWRTTKKTRCGNKRDKRANHRRSEASNVGTTRSSRLVISITQHTRPPDLEASQVTLSSGVQRPPSARDQVLIARGAERADHYFSPRSAPPSADRRRPLRSHAPGGGAGGRRTTCPFAPGNQGSTQHGSHATPPSDRRQQGHGQIHSPAPHIKTPIQDGGCRFEGF